MTRTKRAKTGGRIAGTPNRRTIEFMAVLAENDFNPAKALIDVHNEAKQIYSSYSKIYEAISRAREFRGLIPLEEKAHVYLKIAADAAKDLASYAYPKRKSIEHEPQSPLDGMTPEQKIEAMKQAVKFLEAQVGK